MQDWPLAWLPQGGRNGEKSASANGYRVIEVVPRPWLPWLRHLGLQNLVLTPNAARAFRPREDPVTAMWVRWHSLAGLSPLTRHDHGAEQFTESSTEDNTDDTATAVRGRENA